VFVVVAHALVAGLHACTPADSAAAREKLGLVTAACCYAKKGLPDDEIRKVCAVEEAAAPIVDFILRAGAQK
jgi:hypothetical protein